MRYRITLSYDGQPFCGWQIQPDAPSVQGALEDALGKLCRQKVQVVGAGRTDTGVNAIGYVAHTDLDAFRTEDLEAGCAGMVRKLNAILPEAIVVHDIAPVPDGFHARFDAKRREYTYRIHRSKDPFAFKSYLCAYPELDFDKMCKACEALLGQHDFSCFEKVGADNRTSVCTVYDACWTRTDDQHWEFRIVADRFLRNMVRAIVGTLLEVGRGKRSVESVSELILSRDRCRAGESVPGHALFLTGIEY